MGLTVCTFEMPSFFSFFSLITGPERSLSLKLSDTTVYETQIQACLGTAAPCLPSPYQGYVVHDLGSRVESLGLRVWGSGFRVEDLHLSS